MRHTATPPLVLDLIRLIQSRAEKVDCFTIITFHLLPSSSLLLFSENYNAPCSAVSLR